MLTIIAFAATVPAALSSEFVVDIGPFVAEAAQRTGMPEAVIWAVIDVESRGKVRALSPKGAMGLMQLMPATWAGLRARLDLGQDPFDPHDNIIAGAVYLRTLYDQYGWNGAFAAYNAGPGRYEAHRDSGQDLPAETKSYVVRISEKLDGRTFTILPSPLVSRSRTPTWTGAALFIAPVSEGPDPALIFSVSKTPFVDLGSPVSNASQ